MKHYVYFCYVDGVLRYIGEGKGDRWKHCNSGKSSCALLNKYHFSDCKIDVVKVHEGLSKEDALLLEREHIRAHKLKLWNMEKGVAGPANLKPNIELRQQQAKTFAQSLAGVFEGFKLRQLTQRQMVEDLNSLGIKTIRGKEWSLMQVQRMIKQLKSFGYNV